MQNLNFPTYSFRLKNSENNTHIFDVVRKKFVVLQPEEWVRQHCVQYLIQEKKYPISLINVEKVVLINGLKKRYDIVIFNSDGSLALVVECKAPKVKITLFLFLAHTILANICDAWLSLQDQSLMYNHKQVRFVT